MVSGRGAISSGTALLVYLSSAIDRALLTEQVTKPQAG